MSTDVSQSEWIEIAHLVEIEYQVQFADIVKEGICIHTHVSDLRGLHENENLAHRGSQQRDESPPGRLIRCRSRQHICRRRGQHSDGIQFCNS